MNLLLWKKRVKGSLLSSKLFDEETFYKAFIRDIRECKEEVIIESPYMTFKRVSTLLPVLPKLIEKGIKVYLITRDPKEHDSIMRAQSNSIISALQELGIEVFFCVGTHHRKLAIIDRKILWEGSLNNLSQSQSREIMRRIESKALALEMFNFLKLANIT